MTEYFEGMTDPRQAAKVRYSFIETIIIVICAVIAGCEVWEDIADYCRVKENWFREALGLKLSNGIPSHDTMERIFAMLNPKEFQERFIDWVEHTCGKENREIISIDGKTMRGSRSKEHKPIHMISAWANKAKAVFGQMAVEEKTNEITAVPELLELLDIEGTIITADAMSCQKEIVRRICDKGADYVIGLKENQPRLRQETEEYFTAALTTPQFYKHIEKYVCQEKGHGRIETREYYLCTDPDYLKLHDEWKNLHSVGMMKSRIVQGEAITEETHYYVSSLTDIKEFSDVSYVIEFALYTNYLFTAPYYMPATYYNDTVIVHKDGSMEVSGNPFQLYRSRTFDNDFSPFLDEIWDYQGEYNCIETLE